MVAHFFNRNGGKYCGFGPSGSAPEAVASIRLNWKFRTGQNRSGMAGKTRNGWQVPDFHQSDGRAPDFSESAPRARCTRSRRAPVIADDTVMKSITGATTGSRAMLATTNGALRDDP